VNNTDLTMIESPSQTAEPPPDDEPEWIAAAQHHRSEFTPLYRRYAAPIYRYCYRRLGNRESAEDATSQTFVKALAGIHRFEGPPSGFRSWLYTIADRVVTDIYRRSRSQTEIDEALELQSSEPGPESTAIAAETGRNIQAMIERLTPDQQRVVALRLAGLTGPEIAAVIDREHQAVKSLQFRAYSRLRRMLSAGEMEPS